MKFLDQIQNDALSEEVSPSTLLRKVLVLAARLDSDLLEDWVRHELDGYPKDVELPNYRRIDMAIKAYLTNGFRVVERAPIPSIPFRTVAKNPEVDKFLYRKSIGTINLKELRENSTLRVDLMNYRRVLSGTVIDASFEIMDLWGEIPSSQVIAITDAVYSRVLSFVIKLRKEYPDAGEVEGNVGANDIMEKTVNNIYYNTIHGNVGVAGNANGSTVTVNVIQGQFDSLKQELTRHGVVEADFLTLKAALVDEPVIQDDKSFGPKVTDWITKMIGKAASGAWTVGLGAAGAVLQQALLGYYGYSN